MCGRFAIDFADEAELLQTLDDAFDIRPAPIASQQSSTAATGASSERVPASASSHAAFRSMPRYNVAPSTYNSTALVMNANREIHMQGFRWGLQSQSMSSFNTINARSEVILEGSSSLWNSLKGNRTVIAISGFYEWMKKGNTRVAHYVKRRDGKPLMLAGFYDKSDEGGFTIITCHSSKELSFLHDRMPVILPDHDAVILWMNPQNKFSEVSHLLRPLESGIESYPVPPEVGKVGNESSSFVRPVSERKGGIESFFGSSASDKKAKEKKNDNAMVFNTDESPRIKRQDRPKSSPTDQKVIVVDSSDSAAETEDDKPKKKVKVS